MSIQPPWGAVPKNGRPPVIVVHAITGSALVDEYPLPAEVVWDLSIRLSHPVPTVDFLRIAPHPDDTRFEAVEPARVQSSQVLSIIYGDLVEALRYDLSPNREEPTPVFPFHYDWRQDNTLTAKLLGDFIREVIERTNLLRHYDRSCGCVDLVGHSMGGLVIGACLGLGHHLENGKPLVRRVVTLATPFRGAVDALEKVSTGESTIVGLGSNRERETARITPAIYQLLPSYEQGFVRDGKPINIYDAANWQSTIAESLREFIRTHSTDPKLGKTKEALLAQGRELLQNLLTMGQALHDVVAALNPKEALLDSWRLLVGIDSSTLYQATTEGPQNKFRFERLEEGFDPDKMPDSERENLGDETVPLRGAIPSWAESEKVICVRGDDFSELEIRDRFIRSAVGMHASLPLMNPAQRWVISFLRGKKTGDLWGRPLPGVKYWDPGFPGVVNRATR